MLHGAGIFTYMTGWFLGQMLVNIPAPWSIWDIVWLENGNRWILSNIIQPWQPLPLSSNILCWIPSGKHTKRYWTWPFSSLIYPSKNGAFPVRYVTVYQRVISVYQRVIRHREIDINLASKMMGHWTVIHTDVVWCRDQKSGQPWKAGISPRISSLDRALSDEEVVSSQQQDQPDLAVFGGKVDVTPWTGWWFKTFFFRYWECHHPNWRVFHHFSEGFWYTTNQIKLNHV